LSPKIGKETVDLRKNVEVHQVGVYGYLKDVGIKNLKELKKIVEITQAKIIVNSTGFDFVILQNNYKD